MNSPLRGENFKATRRVGILMLVGAVAIVLGVALFLVVKGITWLP